MPRSRTSIPAPWWENASGMVRFSLRDRGGRFSDVAKSLDQVQEWGLDAVEVFAPYHGGNEYEGLDAIDYFTTDPRLGSMEDFRRLIDESHRRGMAIVAFINLGYLAEQAPAFLRACDAVREGRQIPEREWFLWSDTGERTLDRSLAPYFFNDDPRGGGHWHFSERANSHYFVKWRGIGEDVELPQVNFGDAGWQEECARVVRFWMDTGLDGLIIDAVNWYADCNWAINNATMTDVVLEYPNAYLQPEGAGGFADDPVPWIKDGHYNSVQDYGLSIWWTDRFVFGDAIQSGDPTCLEETLQGYRDRVVAAGGVTYHGPLALKHRHKEIDFSGEQVVLEIAFEATCGDLFATRDDIMGLDLEAGALNEVREILRFVQKNPALHAAGGRKRLETNDDSRFYAYLRTAKSFDSDSQPQEMVVVLNFQSSKETISVHSQDRAVGEAMLATPSADVRQTDNGITLPPYGYAMLSVQKRA